MAIKIHAEMIQGSDAWHAARCGLLTASEMSLIVTPTLKAASNEKERSHMYELLAQRITKYVEPAYVSDAMLRGSADEIDALNLYDEHYAKIARVGFMTNDKWGFTLGYSPDALIGDDGQVECKSRSQKWQMKTLVDYVPDSRIDPDFIIQVQTGLLVSGRKWCDLVSYCGGLPMATVRVFPDIKIMEAIIDAATIFEGKLNGALIRYQNLLEAEAPRLIETERKIYEEMHL